MSRKHVYGDRDRAYFQRLEKERFGLTGPEATYFTLFRGRNVDPLYNEPTGAGWEFEEFCLQVTVEYEEKDNLIPSTREEGAEFEYDAFVNIAKLEWEERAPVGKRPKTGDVIFVQKEYFDVVKANSAGMVVNRDSFVGYRLELRKRSKFDAKRKVAPQHKSTAFTP